jgi:membrane protease YdiL (CAAX protease family)
MWSVAVVVGVLALRNVAGERFLPSAWYVPVNLAVAGLLALVAWRDGSSAADLGLSRSRAVSGLTVGAVVATLAAAVIVSGALLPWTRSLFEDQRIADVQGGGELAYQTLVRIPLGTVVLEEVAFRGVLLALVAERRSTGLAVAVSSLLFGLWHINPTLDALAANDVATSLTSSLGAVIGAVVFTAASGVLFCALRLASDSLLAPMVVHAAVNSTATIAAYLVLAANG